MPCRTACSKVLFRDNIYIYNYIYIYVEQILIFWSWVSVCVCGPFLPYCLVMHFGKLELVLDCCWTAAGLLSECY